MSCDVALNFSQKKLLPNLLMPLEGILKIEFFGIYLCKYKKKLRKVYVKYFSGPQISYWSVVGAFGR